MLPDTSSAEEPVSSEAPNPAEDVDDAAPSDEIEDTAGEAAAEPTSESSDILGTKPADAETPDSENDDTDVTAADDTAAALNREDVSEEADHSDETAAPADDVIDQPEESEGTDAQTPEDTQEETPAESIPEETDESVDEAPENASAEEPAEQPEDYVELEDESAVLLGDTAFFSDRDAEGGETIQNIFLWDGYVENGGKVFKPDYEPGRYVIVMQPVNPATAPYNSFLAFEVVNSESISDTFQNINSYEDFLKIVNELACPAEPVICSQAASSGNTRISPCTEIITYHLPAIMNPRMRHLNMDLDAAGVQTTLQNWNSMICIPQLFCPRASG